MAQDADVILSHFPTGEFPYLAETIVQVLRKPGWDHADEFKFGLDLILDGLEMDRLGGLVLGSLVAHFGVATARWVALSA